MQQKIPTRIVIYAKDVMMITGRKERAAWKLLATIRKKYRKKKGQFVTVKEFSAFTGIDEESIYRLLKN
ncbi:MAG: hypothetical protein J7502_06580 [Flavisolibacter sp.]|nr:hypothetical protein [Flavisolibacter sp.]